MLRSAGTLVSAREGTVECLGIHSCTVLIIFDSIM